MFPRRAAVVGVAAATLLAVTACQPLDTGTSASHTTVKSGKTAKTTKKTTKKSGKVVVRLETKKGSTTTSSQSVTVRSGSVARVTSTGSGQVSCRIVFNGQTVANKSGTGAVTCSATVTH